MIRRLSSREKVLATVVALVVFAAGTFLMIEAYWKSRQRLVAEIQAKTRQLAVMRALSEDMEIWDQREQWLRSAQPRLSEADAAAVQLLDQIKNLAKKHSVLLENPAIRQPEAQPFHTSVAVEIETKSPWSPLIALLHELQSPAEFIAIEHANLKIDPGDPTQMRGRFKIARWYAPQ